MSVTDITEIMETENEFVVPRKPTRKGLRSSRLRAPLGNILNTENSTSAKNNDRDSRNIRKRSIDNSKTSRDKSHTQCNAGEAEDDSYAEDILRYFVELEDKLDISPSYMEKQHDLKPEMRSILVDWIIQACAQFKHSPETQFRAIQYIDRYLSTALVERNTLQLVGICSIFIACKFEEIVVPSMDDLCFITSDSYTKKELESKERAMLKVLDYDLGLPNACDFLRYIVKLLGSSRSQFYAARFLCELMMVSYGALQWRPSEIAVSALDILNRGSKFTSAVQRYGLRIDATRVTSCKEFVRDLVLSRELECYHIVFRKHEAVYEKLLRDLKSVEYC